MTRLGLFAWMIPLVQGVAFELTAPPEGRGPCVVACGLAPDAVLEAARLRVVRCVDDSGRETTGVLSRDVFGTTFRAEVASARPGRSLLRVVDGEPPRLDHTTPRAEVIDGEATIFDGRGPYVWLRTGGAIEVDGVVARFRGLDVEEGSWRLLASDPIRTSLRFDGLGTTHDGRTFETRVYAAFFSAGRRAEIAAVIRVPRGAAGPADVAFLLMDEAFAWGVGCDPPECEEREGTEDVSFESFVESLTRPKESAVGSVGARVVRTAASPVRKPRYVARGASYLALGLTDPEGPLESGEERRVDAILCDGFGGDGRVVARAVAGTSRRARGFSFGRPSRDPRLANLVEGVGRDLSVWRGNPRHGLGFRRDDAGDWFMDLRRAGNLEWDTAYGLAARFCDQGDVVDLLQAEAAVDHLLARDRDERSGLFFMHGAGHRTGRVEIGHHWTEGLRLVATLTDDPRLRDSLGEVAADQIAAFGSCDVTAALPRSLGWGLRSLLALHPFAADKKASEAQIARFRSRIAASATPEGHLDLERAGGEPDASIRVSPFVTAGVVLPALISGEAPRPTAAQKAAARRAAEALRRDAYEIVEGRTVLRSSLFCEPVRGRVLGKSGEATGEERLLFLAGLAAVDASFAPTAFELAAADLTRAARAKVFIGKETSMTLRALADLAAP